MKVCIATIAPFLGGAEVAAERLALGLMAEGHDVFILAGTRGEVFDRMQAAGLRCMFAPMPFTDKWHWLRYERARRDIRRILEYERPAVIHSNDLPTHQIMSDAARVQRVPVICHHRFPFGRSAADWLNKFGAARHVFVSNALMAEMCDTSPRLRESSRTVVYDGLPMPQPRTASRQQQARARLRINDSRVIVTFAGQIIERKGVADLIGAWARLSPDIAEAAELIVIGDDLQGEGRYRKQMEALAARFGCAARFVGFQKNVDCWLDASDVAVVPSHVEPLGNAVLEAMAHGLAVIGADVGGIPEMVDAGHTGLLVPPKDPERLAAALSRLIADAQLRHKFGHAGRSRCEQIFSLRAHTEAMLTEYRAVLPARAA
jgi:glycosyltransferase involved in cell wall biosynthesis